MAQVTLDITALGHRGEGLARHDGTTIPVPLAIPGEQVIAELSDGKVRVLEGGSR